MNTVLLTQDPDPIPAMLSPETGNRMNMDVDNENVQRVVGF